VDEMGNGKSKRRDICRGEKKSFEWRRLKNTQESKEEKKKKMGNEMEVFLETKAATSGRRADGNRTPWSAKQDL